MAEQDFPRGPPGAHSNDVPPFKQSFFDAMAEEKSLLTHSPHPLSAPGFPASPNLTAAFPTSSDLPAFPAGSSLSYGRSDSPLPACLAPRFTQTKSRDDVAADCSMPHAFKQSLDDLCCLNLIGSRNATLEAPRSTNRAAQNNIFDDFSCLGLGLEDESDGLFRSAPQSRSVSPPPTFPPPLAVSPPLDPARAVPGSATGAQVSAFSAALAAATGGAVKSSSAAFADQLPQLPRSAFSPSPANAPAVPLPPSRPPSSSSSHPSYPLSRESLLRRPTRIILVRHGQSEGNLDEGIYTRIADSRVSLTPLGFEQAVECGKQIRKLIEFDRRKGGKQGRGGEGGKEGRWNAGGFLDSLWRDIDWCRLHPPPPPPPPPTPSAHPAVAAATAAAARNAAVSAAAAAAAAVADSSAVGAASGPEAAGSPLLRGDRDEREERRGDGARGEQQEREERRVDSSHAHAETHADTHAPSPPLPPAPPSGATPSPAPPPPGATPPPHRKALNIVMVTHGLTTRVFLMRWFRWTVRQFEGLLNPGNCEIRVMEMGEGGKYSLAVRHSEYELFSWGLTPDMIAGEPEFPPPLFPPPSSPLPPCTDCPRVCSSCAGFAGPCGSEHGDGAEGEVKPGSAALSEYELFSWGLTPDMIAGEHGDGAEGEVKPGSAALSEYELFSWGLTPDMIAGEHGDGAEGEVKPGSAALSEYELFSWGLTPDMIAGEHGDGAEGEVKPGSAALSEYELFSWGLTPDMIAGEHGDGAEGEVKPGSAALSEYELFSWGLTPDMIAGEHGDGAEGEVKPGSAALSEYELFSWGLTPDMIAGEPDSCSSSTPLSSSFQAPPNPASSSSCSRSSRPLPPPLCRPARAHDEGRLPLAASAAMTPAAVPAAVTPLAAAGAAAVAATGAAAVVAPAATAEGAAVAVAAATPAGAAGRAAAAAAETAGVTNRGAPGVAAAKSLQVSHGSSHLPQPVPLSLPTEISFSTNLVSGAAAAPAAGSVAPPAAGSAAGPGVVLAAGSADGFAPASTGASMDENGGMEEEQALICESGGLEEQELEGEGDGFAFMPPGACDEVGGDDSGSPTIGDTDGGLHKSVEWVTDGSRCEVEDSAGRILGWRREKWVAESNDTTPI
ncbi:unnamed protein product [Closterium sp. NIES-54]